jgi:predicted HD superfamily hydrolase involved in NAD metabolism
MMVSIVSLIQKRAYDYVNSELSERLKLHSISTRDYAVQLNQRLHLNVDEDKLILAALCHDLARELPVETLEPRLKEYGINPETYGFVYPILLHGPLSAEIAREKIGITDEEILDTIRWHNTGRKNMSVLEKLLYIADKIEPTRDYPGVEELRALAWKSLDEALRAVIASGILYVVACRMPVDYNTIEAYNQAVK